MKSFLVSVYGASLFFSLSSGSSSYTFPHIWQGEYFHLEYPKPLRVTNTSISEKGSLVWNSGSQYVLKGEDRGEACWRCLSIHRKHQNVLQYKEGDCDIQYISFDDLCKGIRGDGTMHSMFRRHAPATRCPLSGPHMFTYAKGGNEPVCDFPESYVDTCSNTTTLNMHYQACIDVKGSQSKTEEWKCIANWKEGSRQYFVGELMDDYLVSEKSRLRCFMYQTNGSGQIKMVKSGAATCTGLWSVTEGYKVFTLEKVVGGGAKCEYPRWFSRYHTWHNLAHATEIHVNSGDRSIRIQDQLSQKIEHLNCHSVVTSETSSRSSTTYTGYHKEAIKRKEDTSINANIINKINTPLHLEDNNRESVYMNSPRSYTPSGFITLQTNYANDRPQTAHSSHESYVSPSPYRNRLGFRGNIVTDRRGKQRGEGYEDLPKYTISDQYSRSAPRSAHLSESPLHQGNSGYQNSLFDELMAESEEGKNNQFVKIVHHVKSGCDSGYVCTVISQLSDNLISIKTGARSRDPRESCTDLYFSSPTTSLYIARSHHSRACPLNGRYTLSSPTDSSAISTSASNMSSNSSILETMCKDGSSLQLFSGCGSKHLKFRCENTAVNSSDTSSEVEFQCHAHWPAAKTVGASSLSRLVLTLSGRVGYYCLDYTDAGILNLTAGKNCAPDLADIAPAARYRYTQTGPCIQALSATRSTGMKMSTSRLFDFVTPVILLISSLEILTKL